MYRLENNPDFLIYHTFFIENVVNLDKKITFTKTRTLFCKTEKGYAYTIINLWKP